MMSLEVTITLRQTRDILGGLRSNDHHRLEVMMMMMKNAYAKTKWIILLIKDLPYRKQNYDDEECVCKAQNGYPTWLFYILKYIFEKFIDSVWVGQGIFFSQ